MIRRLGDLSLFWKIFLVGLTVSLIPLVVLLISALQQSQHLYEKGLTEKVRIYHKNLSETIKLALEAEDFQEIDRVLSRIQRDPEVVYVGITESRGTVYRRNPEGRTPRDYGFSGTPARGRVLRSDRGSGHLALSRALSIPDMDLKPVFTLIASERYIQQQQRGFVRETILLALVMAGVILLVSYLLANHISGRLGRLLTATEDLRAGNMEGANRGDPYEDEVGKLFDAFNHMARELNEAWTEMERKIEERTEQLLFQEKLSVLGEMASRMAHELNTPLATITNAAEGLESTGEISGDRGERLIELIQDESYRCKTITRQFLDLARSEHEQFQSTSLQELVKETLSTLEYLPSFEEVDPSVDVDLSDLEFEGKPGEMKQVLINLIKNALQALREEDPPEPTLIITGRRTGDEIVLEIRDNGIGFSPEEQENFFEPFYTTGASRDSLGLGLSISRQIVEDHGGTLTLSSNGPHRGCTARIQLPLQPETAREKTPS